MYLWVFSKSNIPNTHLKQIKLDVNIPYQYTVPISTNFKYKGTRKKMQNKFINKIFKIISSTSNTPFQTYSPHHRSIIISRHLSRCCSHKKIVPYQKFSAFTGTMLHVASSILQAGNVAPNHNNKWITSAFNPKNLWIWRYVNYLFSSSIFFISVRIFIIHTFVIFLFSRRYSDWNFLCIT